MFLQLEKAVWLVLHFFQGHVVFTTVFSYPGLCGTTHFVPFTRADMCCERLVNVLQQGAPYEVSHQSLTLELYLVDRCRELKLDISA